MTKKHGHAANPNNKDHMRRLNAVLNGNYHRESFAVDELDFLREQTDENDVPLTDRVILRELLIHNQQNRMGYVIPPSEAGGGQMQMPIQMLNQLRSIIEQSVHSVLANLNLQSVGQNDLRQEVSDSVNHIISTANLMSRPFVYEGDVEDDELPE